MQKYKSTSLPKLLLQRSQARDAELERWTAEEAERNAGLDKPITSMRYESDLVRLQRATRAEEAHRQPKKGSFADLTPDREYQSRSLPKMLLQPNQARAEDLRRHGIEVPAEWRIKNASTDRASSSDNGKAFMGPPDVPGVGITSSQLIEQSRSNAREAQHYDGALDPSGYHYLPLDAALWFRRQVKDGGPWDYKQFDPRFEDFGNYHYGYVGTAAGFPEGVLLRQAGKNHRGKDMKDPGREMQTGDPGPFGLFGGEAPFGDDPRDQEMIKRGVRDRRNGY